MKEHVPSRQIFGKRFSTTYCLRRVIVRWKRWRSETLQFYMSETKIKSKISLESILPLYGESVQIHDVWIGVPLEGSSSTIADSHTFRGQKSAERPWRRPIEMDARAHCRIWRELRRAKISDQIRKRRKQRRSARRAEASLSVGKQERNARTSDECRNTWLTQ